MLPTLSFRARILFIVLVIAVVPLALLGLWLTGTAGRSGEELLRVRLNEVLDRTVAEVGGRWLPRRSDLLLLAETDVVQRALADGMPSGSAADQAVPPELAERFAELDPAVERAIIRDTEGRIRWTLVRPEADSPGENAFGSPPLRVELGIHDRGSGWRLGTLEANLRVSALLSNGAGGLVGAGAALGAFEPSSGAALLPLPFDPAAMTGDRFVWAGDQWLTERRVLAEPPLELVAAAPLEPFTEPFEQAAGQGVWVVLAVAATGLLLATLLTGRMTRSLTRLAAAAEAVSRGDLDRKVEVGGEDEVGRVARSFNTMTESLRRTLRELAHRESLAAIGEFASALAHEVRNPLSSIRLDLQIVEERLPADSPLREIQRGALEEIERVDRTVSGTLLVARSGRITLRLIDLYAPLRAALHAAEPAVRERSAHVEPIPTDAEPLRLQGDAGALEQLFLNLLLNAAQALEPGGRATVEVRTEAHAAVVSIHDTGPGIPPEHLERVREPFFSTKPGGTGLGLAIAHRIVSAHHGEMRIESAPGEGTTVHIRLPLDGRRGLPPPSSGPVAGRGTT